MPTKEKIISKLSRGLEVDLKEAETLFQDKDSLRYTNEKFPAKYLVREEDLFQYQGQNSRVYLLRSNIIKCPKLYFSEEIKNGFDIQRYFKSKGIPVPESEGLFNTIEIIGVKETRIKISLSHSMEYCPYPRIQNSNLGIEEYEYAKDKIKEYVKEMQKLGFQSFYPTSLFKPDLICGLKGPNILWNKRKREPIFLDFDLDKIVENKEFNSFKENNINSFKVLI